MRFAITKGAEKLRKIAAKNSKTAEYNTCGASNGTEWLDFQGDHLGWENDLATYLTLAAQA